MVHRMQTTNFSWTQELGYRDSPLGNLDRTTCVSGIFPLQEGFDSYSQTRFSVGIDYLSALTFEQRIVGAMSISQSTAVAIPFACMPTIHNVQLDVIVKTPLFKDLLEFIKGDMHNYFIEPFSFGSEFFEFFDKNISIVFNSKSDNFFDSLPEICFDKILFLMFQHPQFLICIQRLKFCSSFHKFISFNPDMLTKIGLIENPTFWGDYRNSKMLCVDINSKDISSLLDFLFFGEIYNNLQIFSQTKSLANPIIVNQIHKSLIISILFDWNSNPISWIQSQINKEIGFGIESFAIPRNIELDSQSINFICFLLLSIPYETASDLNIERGVLFAN